VLIRGKDGSGKDLIIAQDYITDGMRIRAQERVTLELGRETDLELRQKLEAEMTVERFTRLDRILIEEVPTRVLDLRLDAGQLRADLDKTLFIGRLKTLERYGLAGEIEPGVWSFSGTLEPTLRELGERGDIVKAMKRALSERGEERALGSYVLHGAAPDEPVVGRVIGKRLDDELGERIGLVIDGTDGRVHHVALDANAEPPQTAASAGSPRGCARPTATSRNSPATGTASIARASTGHMSRAARFVCRATIITPTSAAMSAGWRRCAGRVSSSGLTPTAGAFRRTSRTAPPATTPGAARRTQSGCSRPSTWSSRSAATGPPGSTAN
jgi:hypothetical protein